MDLVFTDPFGYYYPGSPFGPHFTWNGSGYQIENTDYGVKNPDMGKGSTCFGQPWDQIWHSGVDLYYKDRSLSMNGKSIFADVDGFVLYAPTDATVNYPGSVMIIQHQVGSLGWIYSVYFHVDWTSIDVVQGEWVDKGRYLGTIVPQYNTGYYTGYHDDSHLHFEIRNFYDASNIYTGYPNCNKPGYPAGVGYNYPVHPDLFPSQSTQWYDPTKFIIAHEYHSNLPLTLKN